MVMAFEQFKQGCETARAARRECVSWTLAFEELDFQREWHVTATAHIVKNGLPSQLSASTYVSSAYAITSTPGEVIEQLVRMIREM